MLLYHLATKTKPQIYKYHELLLRYILDKRIDSALKLDRAIEYLLNNSTKVIDDDVFNDVCGVGIIVTPEQIENCVEACISEHKDEILQKRYNFNTGNILRLVRNQLIWANGKDVKNEVDFQVFLCGNLYKNFENYKYNL